MPNRERERERKKIKGHIRLSNSACAQKLNMQNTESNWQVI